MENSNEVNSKNPDQVRPQFGSRYLTNQADVFKHNAWDNVEWDAEQEDHAKQQVEKNSTVRASSDDAEKYIKDTGEYWNSFYSIHDNKFFKDRHWLFTEFPELLASKKSTCQAVFDSSSEGFPGSHVHTRILEVGCGAGNTIFPILQTNKDNGVFVYGCDFSKNAVDIVKNHELYNPDQCNAFVCDITQNDLNVPFPENSLDFIILIFVLSAVNPDRMQDSVKRLASYLKPGGKLLFRDYGRYDMAQLRFKTGRCLSDNFYARGDGTKVYFFTQDEVEHLFSTAGLVKEQSLVDRRLQVNRMKLLKMYRIWIQCKYAKPMT